MAPLDPFDYKEPACPLSGGRDFYDFDPERQTGVLPMRDIIARLDILLNQERYQEANRLLHYWQAEAQNIRDREGELGVLSEIIGLSRRIGDQDGGLAAIERAFTLIDALRLETRAAGTVWLNGATTLKAFGKAEEALAYYEKARENFKQTLSPEDALWGGFYNNYALALADVGRLGEALVYYHRAMEIMEKQPNGGLEIAITLMNMAELYERAGEEEAQIETVLTAAQQLLDNPSYPRNGYYAFVCRKCAPTFGHFGWFRMKNDLNERADRIYERT